MARAVCERGETSRGQKVERAQQEKQGQRARAQGESKGSKEVSDCGEEVYTVTNASSDMLIGTTASKAGFL